jgi:hypothetical protein
VSAEETVPRVPDELARDEQFGHGAEDLGGRGKQGAGVVCPVEQPHRVLPPEQEEGNREEAVQPPARQPGRKSTCVHGIEVAVAPVAQTSC